MRARLAERNPWAYAVPAGSLPDGPLGSITPHRARVLRAHIEAGRADAIRAGERPPPLVCARGGPPTARDREIVAEFAAELAARSSALGSPGAAHGPAGAPVAAGGRPCRFCDQPAVDRFLLGYLCGEHRPPANPTPDPSRTARALTERRERQLRALRDAR